MEVVLIIAVAVLVVAGIGFVVWRAKQKGRVAQRPPEARSSVAPEVPTSADTLDRSDAPPIDIVPIDLVPVDVVPVDVVPVDVVPPDVELAADKPSFRDRLTRARSALGGVVGSVLGRSKIDAATFDDLEEALLLADVGVSTTTGLLDDLRARVKSESIGSSEELVEALKADLKKRLIGADRSLRFEPGHPNVWLFVGVNGVGKTTTIGKIAKQQIESGRSVIMAAGDTFRAAAAEQLGLWAERSGATLVRGAEGGDPGSVIFDAVERAASRQVDLVLGDTAGRLQTNTNLMEELRKIRRVADREPGQVTEVLLVLDATTGQNGLVQAKQFSEVADITGVVLTKLDGTAKGGIAFAIQTELGIPIKLVGLGEGVNDLIAFDPDEYVEALFAP